MDLAEIRKQYPQYQDMSDGQLADSLHQKFYADMPQDEFYKKIGYSPTDDDPTPKPPGWGEEIGKAARRGMANFEGDILDLASHPVNTLTEAYRIGAGMFDPTQALSALHTFNEDRNKPEKEQSFAERINKKAGNEPSENATLPQRLVAGGVEAATNPESWIGEGSGFVRSSLYKLASALAGGAGSEAFGEIGRNLGGAPGEKIGATLGGVLGGGVAGATERRGVFNARAKPLHDEAGIERASNMAYNHFRAHPEWLGQQQYNAQAPAFLKTAAPYDAKAARIANSKLALQVKSDLAAANFSPDTADITHRLVDRIMQPKGNGERNIVDIFDIHNELGRLSGGTDTLEAAAAMIARESIRDGLINELPNRKLNKLFERAMGNWASAQKIKDVRHAIDLALANASTSGSAKNEINTIRQKIKALRFNVKSAKGWSPAAQEQMDTIIHGTPFTNTARGVSKMLPHAPGWAILYALATGHINLWFIGAAGVLTSTRKLGELATERQIQKLITVLQEEAPVNKNRLGRQRNLNSARFTTGTGLKRRLNQATQPNAPRYPTARQPIARTRTGRPARYPPGGAAYPHPDAIPRYGLQNAIRGGFVGSDQQIYPDPDQQSGEFDGLQ